MRDVDKQFVCRYNRRLANYGKVCFDSTKQSDLEKVQELNRDTTEYALKQGWLNYRPDPYIHVQAYYQAGMYWKYLRAFKKLVDPNMIMHPGRLALP